MCKSKTLPNKFNFYSTYLYQDWFKFSLYLKIQFVTGNCIYYPIIYNSQRFKYHMEIDKILTCFRSTILILIKTMLPLENNSMLTYLAEKNIVKKWISSDRKHDFPLVVLEQKAIFPAPLTYIPKVCMKIPCPYLHAHIQIRKREGHYNSSQQPFPFKSLSQCKHMD